MEQSSLNSTHAPLQENSRRSLVVVRADTASRHPLWLEGAPVRRWDMLVHSFASENIWDDEPGVEIVRAVGDEIAGPKMRAIHLLLQRRGDLFHSYDHISFLDDDLETDAETINRMFDLCMQYDLDLAQPALTSDSYMGFWGITMVNRSFLLRYTSFVEMMAPIFSQRFLQRCAPSFNENISGWGLDLLWSSWISGPSRMAILDACAVKHARAPKSGNLYKTISALGADPDEELVRLIKKWGLVKDSEQTPGRIILPAPLTHGGILSDGTLLSAVGGSGIQLMRALLNGFPKELVQTKQKVLDMLFPVMQMISAS